MRILLQEARVVQPNTSSTITSTTASSDRSSHTLDEGHAAIRRCRDQAVRALCELQRDDGHWCGELEGDSILQSEYLLMKFILGQEQAPMADGSDGPATLAKIANTLRSQQRADGGWGQYPGSGVDLSATVKAYFVLKLMGDDPNSPSMERAKAVVLQHGGAERCNSFSKFFLACLGQMSWQALPAIPPEIVFLPRLSYFHLDKVAAWTRTMILPLSLVVSLQPVREVPRELGIAELFCDPDASRRMINLREVKPPWGGVFGTIDRTLKLLQRMRLTPLRRYAIRRAERWMLERAGQDGAAATDGLGAIFPPMVYLQIAFQAMGYTRDHPVIQRAERELDDFFLHESDDAIKIQPCFSPVWDTGIALYALTDCGYDQHFAPAARAADWLRDKQCFHVGDWQRNLRQPSRGGGWFFEYNNSWYPDSDDTAMVAMALHRADGEANHHAAREGVRWILEMQNDDGGWAAFDKTRDRPILEYIPFADHNAMQDPSCPDITGRVLECLSWHGYTTEDKPVRDAITYVCKEQRSDGSWFGRWGVNYIYGTWQAVIGPIRCGVDPKSSWVRRAGLWMKSVQQDDGSFGESPDTYESPELAGQGPSTASQTAWGAMVLQEIYGRDDPDLRRAIDWLVSTQLTETTAADPQRNPDGDLPGSWSEPWFTGTGFPKVFYLRYHMYRLYFPLMAIGRYLGESVAASHSSGSAMKVLPKIKNRPGPALRV